MRYLAVAFGFLLALAAPAEASPESVLGEWLTGSGGGRVRIDKCGESVCGALVWLREEPAGETWLDTRNKNEALRTRPLRGLRILEGFRLRDGKWVNGRVYHPENGNTYRAELIPQANGTLVMKGCLGPICQDQTWRRVQ